MAGSLLVWVLRFLHILSGVAWVGGAFFWIMVASPRLLKNGPPAIRRPVLEAMIGGLPRYFYSAAGGTIVFGILLLGSLVGWANFGATLQGTYLGTSYGYALGAGLVLALLMLSVGMFVITPTAEKMLSTMQALPPGPPSAEAQAQLGAMGKKMGMAGMSTILIGTLAIVLMTWAVNQVR